MQLQTLSSPRTSPEHSEIEEIRSQPQELSEVIATEVRKQMDNAMGRIIS